MSLCFLREYFVQYHTQYEVINTIKQYNVTNPTNVIM